MKKDKYNPAVGQNCKKSDEKCPYSELNSVLHSDYFLYTSIITVTYVRNGLSGNGMENALFLTPLNPLDGIFMEHIWFLPQPISYAGRKGI